VVRFWKSTVCLEEIQIDLAICDGVWVVVVDVVVADGETVAAHYSSLAQEAAASLLDRSSPT
jgi:adenine/guanine phosphoribosyltransferase-like PRPP-binding protein